MDFWEHVEDVSEVDNNEEVFDPVEEMRKLWEQEIREGEDFKDELRDMGVNVKEWEEKFGLADLEEPELSHGHSHGEL